MSFCFYPNHEHGCPNVGHCPHLGGAALGTVVLRANENEEFLRYLHATIDAERKRNSELFEENQRLQKELYQVKLELKLERQNKFATNQQKNEEKPATKESAADGSPMECRRAQVNNPSCYSVHFFQTASLASTQA